jgi:hypothetical protein
MFSVGHSEVIECTAGQLQHDEHNPQQSDQLPKSGSKLQDFLLQSDDVEMDDIYGNDLGGRCLQPATSR